MMRYTGEVDVLIDAADILHALDPTNGAIAKAAVKVRRINV